MGDMADKYGDWFTYDRTPRAQIFQSTHETVTDKRTMYYLMRFNNFENSDFSQPQGCNGSIPSAAVAARSDLQSAEVGCVWSSVDHMEGKRNYGAIDVKIIDRSDIGSGSMYAESGPTHVNNIEPFSWKTSDVDQPDFNPISTYNFSPLDVVWTKTNQPPMTTTNQTQPRTTSPTNRITTISTNQITSSTT